MRLTKKVKQDIDALLHAGLDVFLARWERTDKEKDELRYDRMCDIFDFLYERLNLEVE